MRKLISERKNAKDSENDQGLFAVVYSALKVPNGWKGYDKGK